MWTPISLEKYIKLHLKENPKADEKVLRLRIECALDNYRNGLKCKCGKDIWIVGSASSPFACFSCITGKKHPSGDFEIDTALNKLDKEGRRHIDEIDPREINGIFDDDGHEINRNTIKKPSLCLTCIKDNSDNWEDEITCNLNRNDQRGSDTFVCYEYRKL